MRTLKHNSPILILPGFVWLLIVLTFGSVLTGCNLKSKKSQIQEVQIEKSNVTNKEITVVNFLPYWVTSSQFAGYYVAEETGIYRKYGIRLNIIPYQPFITSTDYIKDNRTDFAALWLVNALELKTSGADIVNIAQLSTLSSLMMVTKKKSGINTIEQMNGKKAGIWSGFELQPKALFKKYNLDVKIVPIGSTNNLFLMDGVEITNANWFDEYHSIINSGYDPEELNTFFFADHGLNFLEDGIYCLSDLRKSNPKLCSDFVKATIEGWKLAFSNPEMAIDIVINHAKKNNQPINRVHQKWMLERYRDLYLPKESAEMNTVLLENDYELVGNVLKNGGLIKELPIFRNFYQPVINNKSNN
jgi:NitT/TauT family transport system substrate-binding protein